MNPPIDPKAEDWEAESYWLDGQIEERDRVHYDLHTGESFTYDDELAWADAAWERSLTEGRRILAAVHYDREWIDDRDHAFREDLEQRDEPGYSPGTAA